MTSPRLETIQEGGTGGHPTPKSPESSSPKSNVPRSGSTSYDYFSLRRRDSNRKELAGRTGSTKIEENGAADHGKARASSTSTGTSPSTVVSPTGPEAVEDGLEGHRDSAVSVGTEGDAGERMSRRSSVNSVSFRRPTNPTLPQGNPRQGRHLSPSPERFRKHVAFDNIPVGEPTKNNTLGYTLNVSHDGYRRGRRSRTVMVGVDQNVYSDFALQWLLDEYADDGDEIVCVHVTDKDAQKMDERAYKKKAEEMVERVKAKVPNHRAISIKLEFAVGKLHATFQKLIQVYQPSMLVVGTRGRSLGGFQGLVNTNSFSKYCLQYSPIPTVVVRDYEKRQKKKEKRSHDPTRQTYAALLAATMGKHEADSENSSLFDLEARISPDEEAHQVAAAIGLPAAFDPTLKPLTTDIHGHPLQRSSAPSSPTRLASASPKVAADEQRLAPNTAASEAGESVESGESEASGSEDEFEVTDARADVPSILVRKPTIDEKEQKRKLHEMEVNEAAALKLSSSAVEEDSEDEGGGGADGSVGSGASAAAKN